jgi:nicotinamide riboside kinase
MDPTMSESPPFKIAFIGSHGVGKTTLCYGLAAGLKSRDVHLEVVREVARRSPLPINQVTSVASQEWILHTQIAEELAAEADNGVVICDRSVLDNYVYMLVAAGPKEPLEPLIDHWMTTYDLLLHVPIVDAPSADGVRALDPAFQRAIDERLLTELERRDLPIEYLDAEAREAWLDVAVEIVLDRLDPPQLQLL